MEMPAVLRQLLDELTAGLKQNAVRKSAERLSRRYRTETRNGQNLIDDKTASVAYAASRMPATFGSFSFVFGQAAALPDFLPKTMIDVGAGTGSACWAASCFFDLQSVVCLERSPDMRAIGKELTGKTQSFFSAPPEWRDFDLIQNALPEADLVTAGYVLNELNERERKNALLKLWNAAQIALVLIEPATPENFRQMTIYRKALIENGAFIAAPCPHQDECLNEWCHFGCRVSRSKLHRLTKGGEAPFEDEKFCYLIATRRKYDPAAARVLRRPVIKTGNVTLSLCAKEGITEKTFSKKDGDAYKAARRIKWGDAFIPKA
ncbi:MAG: rRNA methyltransferase [Alphaproteobacteria bacterium]|nr:rRNA methyltransferase [Alphaproteobacteria bacterium]MBO4643880.1 rRNA methyltransferase [Alphaproteobacteria bacterium]